MNTQDLCFGRNLKILGEILSSPHFGETVCIEPHGLRSNDSWLHKTLDSS